jgi:hypothetical protein
VIGVQCAGSKGSGSHDSRFLDSDKITILPVVYIIGDDGKIIYCHESADDKNLASVIEKYLKAHGVT